MDLMNELGPLAIGSRLKRLSDTWMKAAISVYQSHGFDFEPKWFTTFYLLSQKSPLSVMEIADNTGVSHPAVIQIAKELVNAGLINSEKSGNDSRKRMLSLSEKGKEMLPEINKLWQTLREINSQLIQDQRHNILFAIEEMESVFAEKDYLTRFTEYYKTKQSDEVEIVDFSDDLRYYFKSLNLAWISKYFKVEQHDLEQLEEPEKYILNSGGKIFFAKIGDKVVGTCALVKETDELYELAKMAVDENYQGKQIGKKICQFALESARKLNAKRVYLGSNTKLIPAIELYKKVGFYKVDMEDSPYERANIKMQIDFN